MRILVISDSHRVTSKIKEILKLINKDCDYVFHLGDCSDDIIPFIRMYPNIRFYFVRGNCDFNINVNEEELIHINEKKIWLSHGHKYGVKMSYERISYAAEEKQADICLFGHTHDPEVFYFNNILFMNPGSITMPRGKVSAGTYGIIDISDDGEIVPQMIGIRGRKLYKRIDLPIF